MSLGKELSSREERASVTSFQFGYLIALASRRVFFTRNLYLGIGPPGIREGDEACILYGAATPFIIRKREGGGYFLVGECYIHGLMNGEGMRLGEEKEIILY